MKKVAVFIVLMVVSVVVVVAKKDINAWKQEPTLEKQYEVFKLNLNFWNGSYFLKEDQLNDFYGALTDSIAGLDNNLQQKLSQIQKLNSELSSRDGQITSLQQQLDESLKLQNSIGVMGMNINKSAYSVSMYLFIAAVLVLAGFVFLLYKRSIAVTKRTKKEYLELKEEYEVHKKNALDRYTKINMELHKTRLELKKGTTRS
ncbi:hypothetical protein [uncultured Draconibacterium sp.]|uniref:hypothetical protein n=1 Tax=uncultured Draconibacterium sp. TaxID=1573823 RepID=UPI00326105E0